MSELTDTGGECDLNFGLKYYFEFDAHLGLKHGVWFGSDFGQTTAAKYFELSFVQIEEDRTGL